MKHQIIVRYSNRADRSLPLTLHLRKCIAAALEAEHVNVPCEINVLVTDDAGIRAINRAMLGDMVISMERCAEQAETYGHSFAHEVSYLTVHSVLHLLGYDHVDEGEDKRRMRAREKEIMRLLDV